MTTESDRKQARSRFNRTVKMFVCLFLLSLILFFVGGKGYADIEKEVDRKWIR